MMLFHLPWWEWLVLVAIVAWLYSIAYENGYWRGRREALDEREAEYEGPRGRGAGPDPAAR